MTDPALTHLDAPADPRADWDLPAFGAIPQFTALDEVTTRIRADNPSPMTLDGTNTYLVGAPNSGEAVVVDPGPDSAPHRAAVEAALAERDAACVLVLVTHHHPDHAEAARPWARAFGCAVAASTTDVAGEDGRVVVPGDSIRRAGLEVDVVATPGHSSDHVAFRLGHGPLLSGDHVLGRGTSVVAYPDGDLAAYMESLRRTREVASSALYPGHGPVLDRDPGAVIDFYIAHRRFRERQILTLLEEGAQHTTRLVRRIYDDVDPAVLPAAAASTRAALEKLAAEGRVEVDEGGTARLP